MQQDCVVVGASFAGLACATALAGSGARVTVLERKHDPGGKLHTTGILVRDVIEQVPLLDGLPGGLVRRINGMRLYAPNMSCVDLAAPGYFFLATDTPGLMRWLAARAAAAGVTLRLGVGFTRAAGHPSDAARRQPHLFPPARRVRRAAGPSGAWSRGAQPLAGGAVAPDEVEVVGVDRALGVPPLELWQRLSQRREIRVVVVGTEGALVGAQHVGVPG